MTAPEPATDLPDATQANVVSAATTAAADLASAQAPPDILPVQSDLVATLPRTALHERLGIEILHASADRVVGRMPVEGNTQPVGLLHGGASAALAEGLASTAAMLHAVPIGMIPVGLDLNATHHRAATSGWVTGVATPLSVGKRIASYQVDITDDSGRRVCTARLTCLLQPAIP